ncbi:hypothetical protein ABZZ80_06590, partial [Streptomyces sp. NPDC006356]
MTTTSATDGRTDSRAQSSSVRHLSQQEQEQEQEQEPPAPAQGHAASQVPAHAPMQRGAQDEEGLPEDTADFLEHPDPHMAAQAAAVENLLRCWVRET